MLNQWVKLPPVPNYSCFSSHWTTSCTTAPAPVCLWHRPGLESWNANVYALSNAAGPFLKTFWKYVLKWFTVFLWLLSHSCWLKTLGYSQGSGTEINSSWTQGPYHVQCPAGCSRSYLPPPGVARSNMTSSTFMTTSLCRETSLKLERDVTHKPWGASPRSHRH